MRATTCLSRSLATGLGVGLLTVTSVLATGTAQAGPSTATAGPSTRHVNRVAVARRGADWEARQITANGGYLSASPGVPDVNDTAYAVIGLNAVGGHRTASKTALRYLQRHLASLKSSDGSGDDPGALGYFILAGTSAHTDVTHFGGSKPVNNLPARLLRTIRTSGPDAGLAGAADPTYNGAFRQGITLAALSTTNPNPTRNRRVRLALAWLKRQQCTNGLWTSYRPNPTTPCATADQATFTGPDTNSTSAAVQGLAAYRLHPKAGNVLASLHTIQSADGGFPYTAAPNQGSDPDSTALSIQTILAEHRSPATPPWVKHGANPYDALAAYQLGATDPTAYRGAFYYPPTRTPSIFATVQAVPAAAAQTLPVKR